MKRLFLLTVVALSSVSVMAQDRLSLKSTNLKIGGDFRIRYETADWKEGPSAAEEFSKNRLRTRFRLGMSFATENGWNIHAGLATGGSSGTSTNATWGDWQTGDIRLDYAYAEHLFDSGTTVLVGQQKNPYKGNKLLWDGDLRPTGFTVNQKVGPGFVTAGYYNLSQGNSDSSDGSAMGNIYAIQAGISGKGDISYTAALGYYAGDEELSTDAGLDKKYAIEVVQLYGDVGFKAGPVGLGAFLEAGQNLGVDKIDTQLTGAPVGYKSEDNDTYYNIGVKGKASGVSAKIQYFSVEGDSVFTGLSNSDLGDTGVGTTDSEGYCVSAAYAMTKDATIGFSYWVFESIERKDIEGEMLRLELKYKF